MYIKENEFIKFEDIQSSLEIEDENNFKIYLREVFKDLSDRAESNRKKGISKITFWEYIKLPVFISEKLFCALDKDNDLSLNCNEFVEGLFSLYKGDFEETVEIVFNMLDFDRDGWIEKDDTKILISHLPLKTDNTQKNQYKYQMESLAEINEILNHTFEQNLRLNISHFSLVIQISKSDIYIQIICFLYLNKPFNKKNLSAINNFKRIKKSKTWVNPNPKCAINSPQKSDVKILSPSRKSHLKPADCFLEMNLDDEEDSDIKLKTTQNDPCIVDNLNLNLIKIENFIDDKNEDSIELNDVFKLSFDSPNYLEKNKKFPFDLENQIDLENKIEIKSTKKISIRNNSLKSIKNSTINDDMTYENWLYKITETNKIKKYFLCIIGKDIYYYKSDKKDELMGMHNLSGCFVRENPERKFEGKKYFNFSLTFSSKVRYYYSLNKSEIQEWVISLNKAIGCQGLFDFYEFSKDLGEGKFGMVKLAVNKKSKESVAIKIIKKDEMTISDIELVRSEIDIMKLCKHPNVVRLLDNFENTQHIFIVMEYLQGGDLGNYFIQNKFKFDEPTCANILSQVAEGIKYIHEFGIIHRDLKPDNIMLTSLGGKPTVKIMDFGLSKILGPLEKACDGFGTLSFVAPEVLIRQPYNKHIDIWSIGVILYYMLSSILPFDDESDNEEIIAKRTVFEELNFPINYFKHRSILVKDLISKCLIKDPLKRISIDEFLNHQWILKHK